MRIELLEAVLKPNCKTFLCVIILSILIWKLIRKILNETLDVKVFPNPSLSNSKKKNMSSQQF